MRPNEFLVSCNEAWHTGDAVAPRLCPVRIHCILECALVQRTPRGVSRYSAGLGNGDQDSNIADILSVFEVRLVERLAKAVAVEALRQFLCQPAVVRVAALVEDQAFSIISVFNRRCAASRSKFRPANRSLSSIPSTGVSGCSGK